MPRKKSDHPRSEHPFEKISGQSRKSKRRETAARTGANVRILIVIYMFHRKSFLQTENDA